MLVLLLADESSELKGKLQDLGHEVVIVKTLVPGRAESLNPDVVVVEGDESEVMPLLKSLKESNVPAVGAIRDDSVPGEMPEGIALFRTSAGLLEIESLLRLLRTRTDRERQLVDQIRSLEERLETRRIIDRAKGVLMDRFGLSDKEAYRSIQKKAMDSRKTMREIAEGLLVYEYFENTADN